MNNNKLIILKGLNLFYFSLLFLIILALSTISSGIEELPLLKTSVIIIYVFHQINFKNRNIPNLLLFFLGIFADSLLNVTFGIYPLIFLICKLVMNNNSNHNKIIINIALFSFIVTLFNLILYISDTLSIKKDIIKNEYIISAFTTILIYIILINSYTLIKNKVKSGDK